MLPNAISESVKGFVAIVILSRASNSLELTMDFVSAYPRVRPTP